MVLNMSWYVGFFDERMSTWHEARKESKNMVT